MWLVGLVLLSLLWAVPAPAQNIRTVLDNASRTIDWGSNAGVAGGIPNRTTICVTRSAGVSAATLNADIASCSSAGGGVVKLNAGTYNLTALNFTGSKNVTLRGSGPHNTKLVFSSSVGCGPPGGSAIAVGNCNGDYFATTGSFSAPHTNWTAGYARGDTQITVASTAGIAVGQMVFLDQLQDTSDNGGAVVSDCPGGEGNRCPTFFVSNEASVADQNAWARGVCSGNCNGYSERMQIQVVKVTAINGNVLTISPGLYMPTWRAAQSPQVWWASSQAAQGENNGVEDLTLDTLSNSVQTSIMFFVCYNCWAKNIRTVTGTGQEQHIQAFQSAKIEVRNSYFYGTRSSSTGNYGVVPVIASDVLMINNIAQHLAGAFTSASHSGSVAAYNFAIDPDLDGNNWMQNMYQNHGPDHYWLAEGNDINAHFQDNLHGAAPFLTDFRNYFSGTYTGKNDNTSVINANAWRRANNYVGNILGTTGYHDHYQDCDPAAGASCTTPKTISSDPHNTAIWTLGYAYTYPEWAAGQAGYDAKTVTTMVRWGNCDAVTGFSNCRFVSSEVAPSGALPYMPAVSVPATQTIPATFFLSETDRLQWWCYGVSAGSCTSPAYPAIGPDVTCAVNCVAGTGSHVAKIPARLCWEAMADDPAYSSPNNVRLFNPSACYQAVTGGDTTPPAAPTGVTITKAVP